MAHLLALDQGTTSSRAIIFNEQGQILASAQKPLTQHFPQPGQVEHDAQEIWQDQLDCARQALAKAGLQAKDIAAIGLTNQRETTVLWDKTSGQPLAPAIVWQDRRTSDTCAALKAAGHEAEVQSRTGLVLDPYFSATKLAWLLDHTPGARARAEAGELAFGTIDCWLIWQLTAGRAHLTDVSNASRTLLFNIHTSQWDDALLQLFNIPRALLPEVRTSSECFGHTAPDLFGAPIMLGGVAGDQQASLFGQGCHHAGEAKNTYGTGCFALTHTGTQARHSQHGLLTTRAAQCGPQAVYALEGSVFIAGALVQWLRDGLGIIDAAASIEPLAASVTDTGGVHIIPAFAGLGAPYWDSAARGAIVGLTRGSTRAHLARAALEAIAFQSAQLLEAMHQDLGQSLTELRVDGGACANDLLMQIQANSIGIPVIRPSLLETTAWGAAMLAGLAAGVWASAADAAQSNPIDQRFEPCWDAAMMQEKMLAWQRAVQRVRS